MADNTKLSYRHQIGRFILWRGDVAISDVSHFDLMRYVANRKEEGKTNGTLSVITNIFKAFFAWAFNQEIIDKNPAKFLESVRVEPIPDDVRAISLNEWERLKTYAKRKSPRDYAILAFLMDTACRVSAAASLQLDKLDLEHLRAQVYEAKIRKWVDVGFSSATAEALREWLKIRPVCESPYVFVEMDLPNGALRPESMRVMMKKMCRKLGMRVLSPHSLRHAALQFLAKQPDVTLLDVQTKANHLSARTTLRNYFPTKSERMFELSQKYSLVDSGSDVPTNILVLPKPHKPDSA